MRESVEINKMIIDLKTFNTFVSYQKKKQKRNKNNKHINKVLKCQL